MIEATSPGLHFAKLFRHFDYAASSILKLRDL